MYYVIVFLALVAVAGVLVVLRTVASNPHRDEDAAVEQSESTDTVQSESVAAEE